MDKPHSLCKKKVFWRPDQLGNRKNGREARGAGGLHGAGGSRGGRGAERVHVGRVAGGGRGVHGTDRFHVARAASCGRGVRTSLPFPQVVLVVACLPLLFATACQTSYVKQFQRSESNYGTRTGQEQNIDEPKLYGSLVKDGHVRQYRSLRYSRTLSEAVGDLPGVHEAIVMLADNNAYAAVLLDESATGIIERGKEGNQIGTTRGMYDSETGRIDADPNEIATGTNSYFTVDDPRNLSDLFKQRAARRIRDKLPGVSEVHITANRDFINQMNVFREETRRGIDLKAYLKEFNKMVRLHFGPTED